MSVGGLIYKNLQWRGFFYVTSVVLNIAMARALGAELSGKLYFFLNNISLVLLLGSISLDSGITYYVSKKEVSEKSLASFSFIWAFINSVLISVICWLFFNNYFIFFKNDFLFFACITFTLGTFLNIYFAAFFYSYDQYKTPNLILGVFNLLLLIFIPWRPNWLGFIDDKIFLCFFFIATLLQGIFICISWFAGQKREFTFRFFPLSYIAPVIKYSVTALGGNIIYFILYRIDYWFVEYYCTAKSLGNYIQVSRLGQLLILPCIIIAGTLFPQSSKLNFSFDKLFFKKLFWIITTLYILVGLGLFLIGKPVINLLWGKEYDEMYIPLLIIMPGLICLAVSYLFSPVFAGKGKVHYNIFISLASLAAVIACNIVMVPAWGIKGAALATTIGFIVMMILYFIVAAKKFGFLIRDLFSTRK